MSTINVNSIAPESGTTITIGGSGDTVTLGSGANASGFTSGIVGVSTFTSSGTWTKASRESALGVTINRVIVEVQGGGGGASRHDSNAALVNSGGAGGYAKKLLDVSSVASSTITIGTGGTGAATQGVGSAGGASSWADGINTNVVGNGGGGGTNASYPAIGTSGAGGTATGGDFNLQGMNGSCWGGNSGSTSAPNGGSAFYGFGGWVNWSYPAASDKDGIGYGSGGSGMYLNAAGDGAGGIVIVWEIAG
jgi:hypothetical protein